MDVTVVGSGGVVVTVVVLTGVVGITVAAGKT